MEDGLELVRKKHFLSRKKKKAKGKKRNHKDNIRYKIISEKEKLTLITDLTKNLRANRTLEILHSLLFSSLHRPSRKESFFSPRTPTPTRLTGRVHTYIYTHICTYTGGEARFIELILGQWGRMQRGGRMRKAVKGKEG